MSDILLRNIAPKLKRDIETRAKRASRSLSDEIKHLISVGLAHENRHGGRSAGESPLEAMRDAFAGLTSDDQAIFEQALEESRKDFGRPLPDFE